MKRFQLNEAKEAKVSSKLSDRNQKCLFEVLLCFSISFLSSAFSSSPRRCMDSCLINLPNKLRDSRFGNATGGKGDKLRKPVRDRSTRGNIYDVSIEIHLRKGSSSLYGEPNLLHFSYELQAYSKWRRSMESGSSKEEVFSIIEQKLSSVWEPSKEKPVRSYIHDWIERIRRVM